MREKTDKLPQNLNTENFLNHLSAARKNAVEFNSKHTGEFTGLTNHIQLLHYLQTASGTDHVMLNSAPSESEENYSRN